MVCFVNEVNTNFVADKMTDKVIDMTNDEDEDLILQRIAGGSAIEYSPVFSPNGDILFVVCDANIRAYSSSTGEWIRELEGNGGETIVGQQWDPNNSKLLYGCTNAGHIISWKWLSGVVNEKQTLRFTFGSNARVESFNLIPTKDRRPHGLISWRGDNNPNVRIGIFDLSTGFRVDSKFSLNLTSSPVKISVSQNEQRYFALIQGCMLWCVDYEKGQVKRWTNIKGIQLNCVTCHPIGQQVATGDVSGRILMYRMIFSDGEPMTTLYAWHHTTVNTIAFTASGVQFYSGGMENTLVRWDIKNANSREYLPRMLGTPLHVCVGADNQKIAVSANDNGIQILNAQLNPTTIIQNFTWVPHDKTNVPKFPIGLQVNPRNSSLMLNGRVGHLQFFSTHTQSLLYNLDTAGQNRLNIESDRILYNTIISHAALNMDWLATAEVLDDQVHTHESRLKFWHFDAEKQIYALNTQVELPHENGVRALQFSTPYSIDNLLCASSGELDVKVWTLEDMERVDTKGKKKQIWTCIGRISYKDLAIKSLAFSSDTSLLAVGFGNTLCVYASETLRLKCALSAPPSLDGSTNCLAITLPSKQEVNPQKKNVVRKEFVERRKKMNELIRQLLETGDSSVFAKNIEKPEKKARKRSAKREKLSLSEQELLFDQIMASNRIQFFQKINLFDRFNLHVRAPQRKQKSLTTYCHANSTASINANLWHRVLNLPPKHKFAHIHKYAQLQRQHLTNNNLIESFNRLFSFGQKPTSSLANGSAKSKRERKRTISSSQDAPHMSSDSLQSTMLKSTTQVNHVAFAAGEYAHLAIVCTDTRLLIWNLLTLRLQSSYKLAVDKIAVDMYTSLVAVITHQHDLYVFLPGTPLPLYQRHIEPRIHGIAWIPRRFPKARSLTIDWQASTELYFLSDKQELLRLVSNNDMESFNTTATYLSDNLAPLPYTPFAAMLAKQQQNYTSGSDQDNRTTDTYSIGVLGKNSIKELTGLQTHTMAPVSLLSNRFLKSLLIDEEKLKAQQNNANDNETDDDDDDVQMNSDDD